MSIQLKEALGAEQATINMIRVETQAPAEDLFRLGDIAVTVRNLRHNEITPGVPGVILEYLHRELVGPLVVLDCQLA